MCIAIYKPKDKDISKDILRNCFVNNQDGCGYAFSRRGELVIDKGFFKFKTFWKYYSQSVKRNPESNFLIHFRIATHGVIDVDNCHPFLVHPTLCVAHNGIISNQVDDKQKSDTRQFVENYLAHLNPEFYRDDAILKLVQLAIGTSKMIFFDNSGKGYIINSDQGVWDKGVWYSNRTYLPDTLTRFFGDDGEDWDYSRRMIGYEGWKKQYSSTADKISPNSTIGNLKGYCDFCGAEFDLEDLIEINGDLYCSDCHKDFNQSLTEN